MSSITTRIQSLIAELLAKPIEEVTPEKHLVNDLAADSLDTVEMVMALEDEFQIAIEDEKAERIHTVQDAIDYVTKALG